MDGNTGRFSRVTPSHDPVEFGWRQRLVRFAASVPLLTAVAVVVWQQTRFRTFETVVAQKWVGAVLDGTINRYQNILFFPWPDGPVVGLRISAGCTVALLVAPFVLIGALLVAFTRFNFGRLLAGVLLGILALLIVNQARIAVIAFSVQHWGMPGFEFGHKLVGTLIGLAGFALSLVVMVQLAAPARQARRRGAAAHAETDARE